MPVVDASVLVALFKKQDVHHPASRRWFAETVVRGELIVSPVVVLPEVASAVSRSLRDRHSAQRAMRILRSRRLLELAPVSEALAASSAEIALEQGIRGCDSVYVALARQLGMELVTLDREQLERGSAVVPTRNP